MTTTDEATSALAELCKPIEYIVGHAPDSDYSEKGPQRFTFTLRTGDLLIRGDYQAGSRVALTAFCRDPFKLGSGEVPLGTVAAKAAASHGRLSVDDAACRQSIRRRYLPSKVDILASLLLEASSIEGYTDWLGWATDLGYEGAAKLREARTAYATIAERTPILRRMLGNSYEESVRLAGEL